MYEIWEDWHVFVQCSYHAHCSQKMAPGTWVTHKSHISELTSY
jgi:hypothetical protein